MDSKRRRAPQPKRRNKIWKKISSVIQRCKGNGKYKNGNVTLFTGGKISMWLDVRFWTPLYIIVLVIALNVNTNYVKKTYVPDIIPKPTQDIMDIIEPSPMMAEETIPEPTISQEEAEIIALATLADTVGRGRSDKVKEIIMWIAINRSEDNRNGYGLSLIDEIERPKQWQQYDPNGMYLESTYELAKYVHNTWKTRAPRPIYNDMLWFVLNGDGSITVRNQFKDTKNRSEATFGQ